MKIFKKLLDCIIVLNWIVLFAGLFYLLFLQIYPFDIIKLTDNMTVKTPIVKAGESLIYTQELEKKLDFGGDKICWLEDGIIYNFVSTESNVPVGKMKQDIQIKIPTGVAEGRYRYRCDLVYEVSPFRTITVTGGTEYFTVIR